MRGLLIEAEDKVGRDRNQSEPLLQIQMHSKHRLVVRRFVEPNAEIDMIAEFMAVVVPKETARQEGAVAAAGTRNVIIVVGREDKRRADVNRTVDNVDVLGHQDVAVKRELQAAVPVGVRVVIRKVHPPVEREVLAENTPLLPVDLSQIDVLHLRLGDIVRRHLFARRRLHRARSLRAHQIDAVGVGRHGRVLMIGYGTGERVKHTRAALVVTTEVLELFGDVLGKTRIGIHFQKDVHVIFQFGFLNRQFGVLKIAGLANQRRGPLEIIGA